MSDEKVQEFEFNLIFALPRNGIGEDVITDALCAAGCDDALIGLGAAGLVGLAFTRSGYDAEAVISDAILAVSSALPNGANLREVKPDLVSQGEVAARLQVSPGD